MIKKKKRPHTHTHTPAPPISGQAPRPNCKCIENRSGEKVKLHRRDGISKVLTAGNYRFFNKIQREKKRGNVG